MSTGRCDQCGVMFAPVDDANKLGDEVLCLSCMGERWDYLRNYGSGPQAEELRKALGYPKPKWMKKA